jgi:hypothetical protein
VNVPSGFRSSAPLFVPWTRTAVSTPASLASTPFVAFSTVSSLAGYVSAVSRGSTRISTVSVVVPAAVTAVSVTA